MNSERETSQRSQTSASSRPGHLDFGKMEGGDPSLLLESVSKQKRFDMTFMHQKVFLGKRVLLCLLVHPPATNPIVVLSISG